MQEIIIMNKEKIKALIVLIVLSFSATSFGQDINSQILDLEEKKKSLEADIGKINRDIGRTDSLAKEESKRFLVLEDRYVKDIERRQNELTALQTRLDKTIGSLQAEKNAQYSYEIRSSNIESMRKSFREELSLYCSELENLIKKSIPWESETRLNRVIALRRDLENSNATVEEGFSRLKAIYKEETRLGDEITLLNKSITRNDGEVINARVLKIGNQWLMYVNEDENQFGILQKVKGSNDSLTYKWKEDLNFEERQAVKLAIDVKSARKPPQIVKIPVSFINDIETKEKTNIPEDAKPQPEESK